MKNNIENNNVVEGNNVLNRGESTSSPSKFISELINEHNGVDNISFEDVEMLDIPMTGEFTFDFDNDEDFNLQESFLFDNENTVESIFEDTPVSGETHELYIDGINITAICSFLKNRYMWNVNQIALEFGVTPALVRYISSGNLFTDEDKSILINQGFTFPIRSSRNGIPEYDIEDVVNRLHYGEESFSTIAIKNSITTASVRAINNGNMRSSIVKQIIPKVTFPLRKDYSNEEFEYKIFPAIVDDLKRVSASKLTYKKLAEKYSLEVCVIKSIDKGQHQCNKNDDYINLFYPLSQKY